MFSLRRRSTPEIEDAARAIAQTFTPGAIEETTAKLSMAFHACPFMPIEQVWLLLQDGAPVLQWQMLDFQARIGRCAVRVAGLFAIAALSGEPGKGYLRAFQDVGYTVPASEGFDLILGFARRGRAFMQLKDTVPLGAEYTWSMEVPNAAAAPQKFMPASDANAHRGSEEHDTSAALRGVAHASDANAHLGSEEHDTSAALRGFARASDDDAALLVELSNAANQSRPISLVRTPATWPWLQRRPQELWLGDGGYVGVRDGEGCLEVREAYGRGPAFYAEALPALCALAQERGVTRLMGHLPPDHPLVQLSLHHGAEVTSRHDPDAGSFAGLMRPRAFMEKIHPELHDRWMAAHPQHALELRVDCEGPCFTLHFNSHAASHCVLELRGHSGCLLHLCVGYAAPQATLQHHRGCARAAGALSEAAVLAALFPAQHPFISHTDRW